MKGQALFEDKAKTMPVTKGLECRERIQGRRQDREGPPEGA